MDEEHKISFEVMYRILFSVAVDFFGNSWFVAYTTLRSTFQSGVTPEQKLQIFGDLFGAELGQLMYFNDDVEDFRDPADMVFPTDRAITIIFKDGVQKTIGIKNDGKEFFCLTKGFIINAVTVPNAIEWWDSCIMTKVNDAGRYYDSLVVPPEEAIPL